MIPFAFTSFRYFVFKSNVGQIKCFSVFRVAGLKTLSREGKLFFNYFIFRKKYTFMHFERHKIIYFFQKNLMFF